ncbi:MAG: saccharopine dehydrogenase NADP-binding domain-containing protein [Ignavibacteriales bacterium]|nr:saccharopine dehydrogenase NADP-binding domain-containing protein [Ignavibacteriales bacterium]
MNKSNPSLMVYGANGYSAKLIIEELLSRKIQPVIAGRNEIALKHLAQKYNCEYKVFDLNNEDMVDAGLREIHTVINCAGPFIQTAKDLMEACLRTKTNYLDITGEMPVMHLAFALDDKAKKNGIVILPSVGFDIIPTDCLAKRLSERMPDATHLKLGFKNKGGKISRGTLLTSLGFLGRSGRIRRDGKLIESEIGEFYVNLKLENFSFAGISIPWGDVYSSYHSTKIPNVEVYLAMSGFTIEFRKLFLFLLKILKNKSVKKLVSVYIKKNLTGPNKAERDSAETFVWGRVENAKGEMIEEVYQVLEGYNLTAKGAAECAIRILKNEIQSGSYTPSLAFGSKFMDLFVIQKIV